MQKRKVTEDFDERKCASKKLTYERNLKREYLTIKASKILTIENLEEI